MTEKFLSDFLPDKNSSYFKEFKNKTIEKIISNDQVIIELQKVMDPEIPVNLYDLGLIYKIEIDKENNILIEMTLTNPNCPVAGTMPESVGKSVEKIENISSVNVRLVWYPKWDKKMMSEDAKLALDIF
jgi:FeS assembly SUF system protein|tara:strand:+ start:79 stop:465 length:387 start_codon:yes stop_codon:yes gene_type:complete